MSRDERRGPGIDLCGRCGAVAQRLIEFPDGREVLACRDCATALYVALTVAATNRGRRG